MNRDRPSPSGCTTAAAYWMVFVGLYPAIILVVGMVTVAWLFLGVLLEPSGIENLAGLEPQDVITPGLMGGSTLVQLGLMLAAAAGMALTVNTSRAHLPSLPRSLANARARVRHALALRSSPSAWLVCAALGALTVGMLPSWVLSTVVQTDFAERWGLGENLLMFGEAVTRTDDPGWILLALAVVVGAPIVEELVFRGFLWEVAERAVSIPVVWITSSALFALYHLDPLHVLTVFPIGLYLGYLRWMSGSIWPGIVAHGVNNGLALVLTLWLSPEAELPLSWSVLGMGFTLGCCGAAWAWSSRQPTVMEE